MKPLGENLPTKFTTPGIPSFLNSQRRIFYFNASDLTKNLIGIKRLISLIYCILANYGAAT